MKRRGKLKTLIVMLNKLVNSDLSFNKLRAIQKLAFGYLKTNLLRKYSIQYIEIMTTYACNARCKHCSNEKYAQKRNKGLLTKEKVEDIIHEISGMGVPVIIFLGGEPMLDENIFRYVQLTHESGMLPMIASNGQVFTRESLIRLKDAHVDTVSVTIYSTKPEINAAITGLEDYLKRALQTIVWGQELGLKMALKTVVDKSYFTSGEIYKIIDLACALDVFLSINPMIPTGAAHNKASDELMDQNCRDELETICAENDFITTHFTSNYFGYGCPAGKAYMGVTPYGDVLGCYFVPVAFGNVWDSTLREINDRITKTKLFSKIYGGCPAAYDSRVIAKYICPCFDDITINSGLPVDVEKHPAFDAENDKLRDVD